MLFNSKTMISGARLI